MVGAGAAEMLGPDLVEFACFANQNGGEHAASVGVAWEQALQTFQRAGANIENRGIQARSTTAG